MFARYLMVGILVLCQSCVTQVLWEATNPSEPIWLDASKVTEDSLKSRDVAYEVHETPRGRTVYLIEKSGWQKVRDYQLRALGTPPALVLDAAIVVVAVGGCLLLIGPGLAETAIRGDW